MKKVSIILPTFNREKWLPRSIESVLAQTYQDWDLWVIDDGSTDGTEKLVKSYCNTQIHYHKTSNKGVSHARNLGINQSQGEWLAFLDSDDEWLPQKLELQIAYAQKFPTPPLIHTDEVWWCQEQIVPQKKKHKKRGGFIFDKCIPLCCISPSAAMVQRNCLNKIGLFNENFVVCEDYDLWLRICSHYPVGFVNQALVYKHGGHGDQLSHKYKAMDYWRLKALWPFLTASHISPSDRQLVRDTLIKKSQILINGYRKHNNLIHLQEVLQIQKSLYPQSYTSL